MSFIAFVIVVALGGLVVGALARLAVPGPDPMSIWMTIALGLAGTVVGGIVVRILFGTTGGFFAAVLAAIALLAAYRRYVQKRPFWGPGARRPPG
jgi:uncharacterized membrane protein YeaQ/YmgE (transglycosylase-associated protein family)